MKISLKSIRKTSKPATPHLASLGIGSSCLVTTTLPPGTPWVYTIASGVDIFIPSLVTQTRQLGSPAIPMPRTGAINTPSFIFSSLLPVTQVVSGQAGPIRILPDVAQFTVPTIVSTKQIQGTPVLLNNPPTQAAPTILSFGIPSAPGVAFEVTFANNLRRGQMAFLQIMNSIRTVTRKDGQVSVASTNGVTVLDGTLPYNATVRSGQSNAIAGAIVNGDIPSQPTAVNDIGVAVVESFVMYVVYKDSPGPDSVWVALGMWAWTWLAAASRTDTKINTPWNFLYTPITTLTPFVNFAPALYQVPTWVGNVPAPIRKSVRGVPLSTVDYQKIFSKKISR
jgi:hypothetical protein